MVPIKSSDLYIQILAALLNDIQTSFGDVFTPRSLALTLEKAKERCAQEGTGFLTKSLPRLGRALDKALSSSEQRLPTVEGFQKMPNSEIPMFMGELLSRVFRNDGTVLSSPCVESVRVLRQVFFLFYKLDLPYDVSCKQDVIDRFVKTEEEVIAASHKLRQVAKWINDKLTYHGIKNSTTKSWPSENCAANIIRRARYTLNKVFRGFDPRCITPKHGPGSVSTKEALHQKYVFKRINPRIQTVYPYDAYFCASAGHVEDSYRTFEFLEEVESSAKVVLVPKDSRGPRLISEEPLENQWVQQGLSKALVDWIEHHPLTREHVRFTNQEVNRWAALYGSSNGEYATLDLKDASDRVSLGLVDLMIPDTLSEYLYACRSLTTTLPDGRVMPLEKHAPMGSALCFPVMAILIWAICHAAVTDQDARESILVYGDDVIVPRTEVPYVITALEAFGLKVNTDKSCFHGFFRESCGMDAFRGSDVTPVKIKTAWNPSLAANTYVSYIEYSNRLYELGYKCCSEIIATAVQNQFGPVPSGEMGLTSVPSLTCIPDNSRLFRRRVNSNLQRLEWRVPAIQARSHSTELPGWLMLLRHFTEGGSEPVSDRPVSDTARSSPRFLSDTMKWVGPEPFRVRRYTRRDDINLSWRWRAV